MNLTTILLYTQLYGHIPESTLCFIKVNFNIFAVGHTELYKNRIPPVVPLSSCWKPERIRIHIEKVKTSYNYSMRSKRQRCTNQLSELTQTVK